MQIKQSSDKDSLLETTHCNSNTSSRSLDATETAPPIPRNPESSPLTQPASAIDWPLIEPNAATSTTPFHQPLDQYKEGDWVLVTLLHTQLITNANIANNDMINDNMTREGLKTIEALDQSASSIPTPESIQQQPSTTLKPKIPPQDSGRRQLTLNSLLQWLPALNNEYVQCILGGCFIMTVAALSAYDAVQGRSPSESQNPVGFTLWRIN